MVVLGACVALPIFLGGLLAGVPVLAVAAIEGLGVASAWLAARHRFGTLAMTLSLPMVGVGLSYSDVGTAAGGLLSTRTTATSAPTITEATLPKLLSRCISAAGRITSSAAAHAQPT